MATCALTIADLSNGKRDLETIASVANSSEDWTTTRTGQQTLTVSGALRRLGYSAPVVYAPGLAIDSGLSTVEKDGVIYAPLPSLVPFTTGAWNPAQWHVVQLDPNLRADLASSAGASMVGYGTSTVEQALQKIFPADGSGPLMGLDSTGQEAILEMVRKISSAVVAQVLFGGYNGNGQFQGVSAMLGTIDGDAFYGHKDGGAGYAFHGVSSSPNGSGGGFAADSETGGSSGVVGNRYNGGSGNGVVGNRLANGAGNGLEGNREGSGEGAGVRGNHIGTGSGAAVVGVRSGTGSGEGVWGLAQGPGGQDAGKFERTGAGAGQAVVGVRSNNLGATLSVGYLGFHDISTGESAGVYGAATGSGPNDFAGKFDGKVKMSGGVGVNGGVPQGRINVTGSRDGNAALQSLLNALQDIGFISNGST